MSDHGLNKNTSLLFTSFHFHVQQTRGSTEVNLITFYSRSCRGQETAKGLFGLRVKLPPVYHTRWRLQTVPFNAERQAGKLRIPIFSLWFDQNGNRTPVYRFSSRPSIPGVGKVVQKKSSLRKTINTASRKISLHKITLTAIKTQ